MPYGGKNPAAKGRGGDTELGHLTPGKLFFHLSFPNNDQTYLPKLQSSWETISADVLLVVVMTL